MGKRKSQIDGYLAIRESRSGASVIDRVPPHALMGKKRRKIPNGFSKIVHLLAVGEFERLRFLHDAQQTPELSRENAVRGHVGIPHINGKFGRRTNPRILEKTGKHGDVSKRAERFPPFAAFAHVKHAPIVDSHSRHHWRIRL